MWTLFHDHPLVEDVIPRPFMQFCMLLVHVLATVYKIHVKFAYLVSCDVQSHFQSTKSVVLNLFIPSLHTLPAECKCSNPDRRQCD